MRVVAAVIVAMSLAACSTPEAPRACLAGQPSFETQLYFGLSKAHGVVSKGEWEAFVAREIAPRFPEGFSIIDARGFWLSEEAKRTISENSKVLVHIHDGGPEANAAINAIIASYKKEFAQEAVLRVDREICAAF